MCTEVNSIILCVPADWSEIVPSAIEFAFPVGHFRFWMDGNEVKFDDSPVIVHSFQEFPVDRLVPCAEE